MNKNKASIMLLSMAVCALCGISAVEANPMSSMAAQMAALAGKYFTMFAGAVAGLIQLIKDK